jgi:hypothetical protein
MVRSHGQGSFNAGLGVRLALLRSVGSAGWPALCRAASDNQPLVGARSDSKQEPCGFSNRHWRSALVRVGTRAEQGAFLWRLNTHASLNKQHQLLRRSVCRFITPARVPGSYPPPTPTPSHHPFSVAPMLWSRHRRRHRCQAPSCRGTPLLLLSRCRRPVPAPLSCAPPPAAAGPGVPGVPVVDQRLGGTAPPVAPSTLFRAHGRTPPPPWAPRG